jgi:hypothetical protein
VKSCVMRSSRGTFLRLLALIGGLAALCLPLCLPVQAASLSGESTTIFRMGKTTDDRALYPLYEYVHLGIDHELAEGTLSGIIGGWGRLDTRDTGKSGRTEEALQYGMIRYGGNSDNMFFTAGRLFIAEGVAAERIDGLYFRSDLAAGFGAAAFIGSPVTTGPDSNGGDLTYGGRITQGDLKTYTIGLSAIRTNFGGSRLREEAGIDIWVHPLPKVDIVGRSSYNSITSHWMEHAYTITLQPLDILRVTADLSNISYRDYFYQVTTNALSLTNGILNPDEKVLTMGGSIDLLLSSAVRLTADYKNFDYDIAGQAQYFGGKVSFSLPESFVAGFSLHRMDGDTSQYQYDEYRLFASKNLGKVALTADFFDLRYDSAINGIDNTYSAAASVAYQYTDTLSLSADIDYMKSIDFDRDLRGLFKVTWSFDKELNGKGGKGEK